MELKEAYIDNYWELKFSSAISLMIDNVHVEMIRFHGGILRIAYLSQGVSGVVYDIKVKEKGKIFRYAVKVQNARDYRSIAEIKYIERMAKLSESGHSFSAWMIDTFTMQTKKWPQASVIVMMKADGTLLDAMRSNISNEERLTLLKHALVSTFIFHDEGRMTHGDNHVNNYFLFDIPMEETTYRGLKVPKTRTQVILYDFGFSSCVDDLVKTTRDSRGGRYALPGYDSMFKQVTPIERMNLDYRTCLTTALADLSEEKRKEPLFVRIEEALDALVYGKFSSSHEMVKVIFGYLEEDEFVPAVKKTRWESKSRAEQPL